MSDEELDYFGEYFISEKLQERYGITFYQFITWMDDKPTSRFMKYISLNSGMHYGGKAE